MTASYDKLVIDNEIIGMVMRAVDGIQVDAETLAFDLIKKIGPGGHFVAERHTRRHMRSEQYVPGLSNRDDRDKWRAEGALDARNRAAKKVKAILAEPLRCSLSERTRKLILEEIQGIRPFIMQGATGN
jgi:trimethylamine--corrinoid protein Co-methyltransferase